MIHSTAIVDPGAELDPSVEVGPYVVIEGPVRIGGGTTIAAHAHILSHTEIGRNCRIHTAAVIGDTPQDRSFAGGVSYVRIGDETILREQVTVHRGTAAGSETTIGQRCMLLVNSHVGHNCHVGDDVLLVNGAMLGGHVHVGNRAVLSGNVAVHQFARIGELAMIGGLAKITQDVPPFLMFDGPGQCVGVNVIGLRRAGMTAEQREEIKQSYRLLYRTAGTWSNAVARVAELVTSPPGLRLLEFLKTPSRRGIHARSEPQPE